MDDDLKVRKLSTLLSLTKKSEIALFDYINEIRVYLDEHLRQFIETKNKEIDDYIVRHAIPGEPGVTPRKGADYFTDAEIEKIKKEVTPQKGVHYFTDAEVENFKREITPVKGVDYRDGIDGKTPQKGVDYVDGIDGLSPSVEEVAALALEKIQLPEQKDYTEEFKALNEKIEELQKQKTTANVMTPRYVWTPWVDTFSTQTNGVTKVFILSKEPRNLDTIKGWGSDFPHILHRNSDFSISRKTITLNATVPAPSSGSTLVFEYYT